MQAPDRGVIHLVFVQQVLIVKLQLSPEHGPPPFGSNPNEEGIKKPEAKLSFQGAHCGLT